MSDDGERCERCGEVHSGDDLDALIDRVLRHAIAMRPRVAFMVDESGASHFAASVSPHRAASALRRMADRVERDGGTWRRDHMAL